MAEGTRWIIASHVGWDMNQRILGVIPKNYVTFALSGTTLVTDAHFMAIPTGLDPARENATIALMQWLMQPNEQAVTFDSGYFYPGPSIQGVTLDMAPQASQDKIRPFIRPDFDKLIASLPKTQLGAEPLVQAFDLRDKLVGSKVK